MLSLYHDAVQWMNYEQIAREDQRAAAQLPYFQALVTEVMHSVRQLDASIRLFRARIHPVEHSDATEPLPLGGLRAPPLDRRSTGRLNRRDMFCLYTAMDPQTALAEVRPWMGARISVAEFALSES